MDTIQEVDEIMKIIDSDGSNTIEFDEFFDVFKAKNQPRKSLMIFNSVTSIIIKYLIEFKEKGKNSEVLPFSLYVSQERRKKLISGFLYNNPKGLKLIEV